MNKSIKEKSKDELEDLLKYLEKAKKRIIDTLNNAKEMYETIIKNHKKVEEELKGRGNGKD